MGIGAERLNPSYRKLNFSHLKGAIGGFIDVAPNALQLIFIFCVVPT